MKEKTVKFTEDELKRWGDQLNNDTVLACLFHGLYRILCNQCPYKELDRCPGGYPKHDVD